MKKVYKFSYLILLIFLSISSQLFADDWGKQVCKKYKKDLRNYRAKFPKNYLKKIDTSKIIFLVTPQCNTPLMKKCLAFLTGKLTVDHSVVKSLNFSELKEYCRKHNKIMLCTVEDLLRFGIQEEYKKIVLLRDPRDKIMSTILTTNKPNLAPPGIKPDDWRKLSIKEKIHTLLLRAEVEDDPTMMRSFYSSKNLIVKYEEMVRRTRPAQKAFLQKIASYLGAPLNQKQITFMFNHLYPSGSLKREQTRLWQKYFDEEDKTICKQIMGDYLIELGYESSYYW